MAKSREQKEEALQMLTTALKEAKSAVFANFQGLSVAKMEQLRNTCREQNIECIASKKTLVRIALEQSGITQVNTKSFEGGIATFIAKDDEIAPAQIVAQYAKQFDIITIFGGVLEGQFIDEGKVKALSALPSKPQMLAQFVGTLNAPISGFVNVLAGNLRNFVGVLSAIKESKS